MPKPVRPARLQWGVSLIELMVALVIGLFLILGAVTLPIGVGLILLLALGIWMLADLFLIPGMVNQQRDLLRQSLRSEFAAND